MSILVHTTCNVTYRYKPVQQHRERVGEPSDKRGRVGLASPTMRSNHAMLAAAPDKLAPVRSATPLAARQRPLRDGENFGGEVSFQTSLSLHITRSPRR